MTTYFNFFRTLSVVTSLFIFSATIGLAQNVTESGKTTVNTPRDNFYDRTLHKEKKVLAYDYIHEKDVMWEKRVWRLVDVREKMNHIFTNPENPFIKILLEAAEAGDATLYSVMDDEFKTSLTLEEVSLLGSSVDTVLTWDPVTFEEILTPVENILDHTDIKQYRLKEVWYFDEETSSMGVRILGIAPIINRYDDNGNFLNSGPMFWAYYPELREVLARQEAANTHNDAARMSWEDIFEARLFASYITKESNIHDRRIKDYKTSPIDVLLESDKIKNELFHFEHDLWTY